MAGRDGHQEDFCYDSIGALDLSILKQSADEEESEPTDVCDVCGDKASGIQIL